MTTATFEQIAAFLNSRADAENDFGLVRDSDDGLTCTVDCIPNYLSECTPAMTKLLADAKLTIDRDSSTITFDVDMFPLIHSVLDVIRDEENDDDQPVSRQMGLVSDDDFDYNCGYIVIALDVLTAYAISLA